MKGWIDIFATKDITIKGDTPPAHRASQVGGRVELPSRPTAPACTNSFGGVITIKSIGGKVDTSGQAVLQANADRAAAATAAS